MNSFMPIFAMILVNLTNTLIHKIYQSYTWVHTEISEKPCLYLIKPLNFPEPFLYRENFRTKWFYW